MFRSICSTCWTIVVGAHNRTGVSPDETVLVGDEQWKRSNLAHPTLRASEYRQSVMHQDVRAITWDMTELDPTLRYRIPDGSQRLGYYECNTFVYQTPADNAKAWQ